MPQEKIVLAKVSRRLIPYLFLCYILNYLDRFNVSFAALQMKADLAFSDKVYGLGAGVFFIGYVLFEVPSNLVLQRVGARLWITRIMLTWGLVSCCFMLVRTPPQFYLLRFLLGAAEAGFFPGIIFYLTHWIPEKERAKVFALFLTSTSLAGVVGGPLSAGLMRMGGFLGLTGWQWLFLLEGLPSVVLGAFTYFYLIDRPKDAPWLTPSERSWLERTMTAELKRKAARHNLGLWKTLLHPWVWQLCLLYFSMIISFYGVAFWLPQIVKNFSGLSVTVTALVSALPYLAASVGMVLVARHSDRTGERRWHVALSAWAACLGLTLGALFHAHHPLLAFLMLCVTATGIWSTLGPFWSLPTAFLGGAGAAGGIALINSVGNIGGFVGPNIIGYVKEATHHFESGMLVLALSLLIAGFLALSVPERRP